MSQTAIAVELIVVHNWKGLKAGVSNIQPAGQNRSVARLNPACRMIL